MSFLKKYYFPPALFFAVISSLIIFSWFRYGFLYGGGDVGLPIYDPQRIFEITKYIWWESAAPGFPISNSNTTLPLQFFLSFFQFLGFTPVMLQASMFFILLFLMGYGMFLVGITVFGKEKRYLALLAGLFYMLNPYMMLQVWHRFIHTAIFLAAVFPFFFIFFKSWVKTGRYVSLMLFLLTNLLAVYLYGTLAFVITVLVLILLIFGFEVLIPWNGIAYFKLILFRVIVGIIFLFASQAWWLIPVQRVAPAILSSQHSVSDNLSTLLALSTQTIIPYSILGINPYYLYHQADFGEIFNNYFFRIFAYLPLVFLIPGFMVALKNKQWTVWSLLLLVSIFLAKGASNPFGHLYILGFTYFFPLGVLRNPFEKLGILIPFSYAILLPIGIYWYLTICRGRIKNVAYFFTATAVFIMLVVNLWPMWFGKMFGQIDEPAFVKVPTSYPMADDYIKNQVEVAHSSNKGKILHLPLTYGESINYKWQNGYSGVEPSQLLFKSLPSISHGFNLMPVDDALMGLSYIFLSSKSDTKILKLLQAFNVRFIVLHKDVDWYGGYLPEPAKLESIMDRLTFLEKKSHFDDLIIYEIKKEYFEQRLTLTNNVAFVSKSKGYSYWPWLLSSNKDILLSPTGVIEEKILQKTKELVMLPEYIFLYRPQVVAKENILGEMPAAKYLPDHIFYILIKIKEKAQYLTLKTKERFPYKITLAGKRLTESYLLKRKKSPKRIDAQLFEYKKLINGLIEDIQVRSGGDEGKDEISVQFILSRHLAMLNLIKDISSEEEKRIIDETINELIGLMKATNVIPHYQEDDEDLQKDKLVSRFNLSASGSYELLQAREEVQDIYPDKYKTSKFQINGKTKNLAGTSKEGFISFGFFDLSKGLNEVIFEPVSSINLAKLAESTIKGDVVRLNNEEIEITSGSHESSSVDIDIDPFGGSGEYKLIFQSWIKLGDGFNIKVIQDTDPWDSENPGQRLPSYDNNFIKDAYDNYWINNVFTFNVKPIASKATLRLTVNQWNGCKHQASDKSICDNKQNKYKYESPSKVMFKDLKIVKSFHNRVFLRTQIDEDIENKPGEISFVQNNPTSYTGKIDLYKPGFLIFKETFHPGWMLKLSNLRKALPGEFISNLYGNAWFIEKPGNYEFRLEFEPERNTTYGLIISGVALVLLITLMIKQKLNND